MKTLILFLLFAANTTAFALSSKKESRNNFLHRTSASFLELSKNLTALDNRHIDRLVEARPEFIQQSCADFKDTLAQFSQNMALVKDDFKNKSASYEDSFIKSLNNRFQNLEYLTEMSLRKCADTELGLALDLLRTELMNTGFLIQSYRPAAESI